MNSSRNSVARPASLLAILALLAGAFVFAAPVAADSTLTADLTGAAEVPGPGDAEGSGTATVVITTTGGEICVNLTWAISDGTAAAAHIHEGAAGEAPADNIVLTLFDEPNDTGAFDDCFNDPTLAAEIEANPANYYVNIHSENFPAGAVRGQLGVAAPATGMLMIMKHYCNADDSNPETTVDVRSEEEFQAVEAGGGGDPVVAVALTILACPVERLPGDEPVPDTIAHFEEEFDFLITDSTGATFTLAEDGVFTQAHACEQERDDGPIVIGEVDGDETTNVCVDFSFYSIEGVAEGEVTVTETFHEGEHEYGTVRFTPAELDPDDDSRTLLVNDRETSTVVVDTSLDGDAMTMLHIYNFDTAVAAAPTATPAPSTGTLPDTSAGTTGTFGGQLGLLAGLAILTLGGVSMLAFRTASARRTP